MRFTFLLIVLVCFSHEGMCKPINDNQPLITYDASGSDGWAPYYMLTPNGDEYGILPELLKQVFSIAKLKARSVNFPPKRTNVYIQQGILDMDLVNPLWIADQEVRDSFVYSDGLFEVKEYYVSASDFDPNLDWKKTDKPRVGMVRGYYYHNQEQYTRLDFPSEKALIEALDKSRVNVIICGDLPALFWAKKLKVTPSLFKLHSQGQLRLRMRKELSYLLPTINQAIKQLKREGHIEDVINKYQ